MNQLHKINPFPRAIAMKESPESTSGLEGTYKSSSDDKWSASNQAFQSDRDATDYVSTEMSTEMSAETFTETVTETFTESFTESSTDPSVELQKNGKPPKAAEKLNLTAEELSKEYRLIWRSLLFICLGTMLVSSSYLALINISASLFAEDDLGATALALGGASQVVGAVVVVPFTTKVWGVKRMVSISMFMCSAIVIASLFPMWETLLPGAFVMGVGISILVSSVFTYGNILGYWYSRITGKNLDNVLVLMAGLVNCSLGSGFLWGNILMFLVLDPGSLVVSHNSTDHKHEFLHLCGAQYCNQDMTNSTMMVPPPADRYYMFVAILLAMIACGIILSFFVVDFMSKVGMVLHRPSDCCKLIRSTLVLLKDPRGFLPLVMTLYIGLEESFVLSNYPQAYVSCTLGIPKVGLVMFSFGIAQIIASIVQWPLVKLFGRPWVVIFGCILLLGCYLTLLFWTPHPDQLAVFIIIIAVWGTGDSILISIVFSVYGLLFEDNLEGAFSVCNFWWSAGFMVGFGCSLFMCTDVKVYMLIVVMCVALVLYLVLEYMISKKKVN